MNRVAPSPLVVRALEVAEKRLGLEELSRRLGAPEATLKAWRVGLTTMPQQDFMRLVDLLTELPVAWDEWNPPGSSA